MSDTRENGVSVGGVAFQAVDAVDAVDAVRDLSAVRHVGPTAKSKSNSSAKGDDVDKSATNRVGGVDHRQTDKAHCAPSRQSKSHLREGEFRLLEHISDLESMILQKADARQDGVQGLVEDASSAGENPLDIQERYLAIASLATAYSPYQQKYVSEQDVLHNVVYREEAMGSDVQKMRAVQEEIRRVKTMGAFGMERESFSTEKSQEQMYWYKKVNCLFIMFLYDVS